MANHLAAPLRASARVDVAPLAVRPDAGVGDVVVARVGTHVEEAAYLADWLAGATSRAGTTAAVLCRKRSQFGPVMEALDAAGVPYEVVGLGGLLLTPEILDLVSGLRAIADPSRGDALMRLPVSYTHLDVYKRQGRGGACGAQGARGPARTAYRRVVAGD